MRSHRVVAPAPGWAKEYEALLEAYSQAGGDPAVLAAPKAAALVVSANRALAANEVPGVHFEVETLSDGVQARIVVAPDAKIERSRAHTETRGHKDGMDSLGVSVSSCEPSNPRRQG